MWDGIERRVLIQIQGAAEELAILRERASVGTDDDIRNYQETLSRNCRCVVAVENMAMGTLEQVQFDPDPQQDLIHRRAWILTWPEPLIDEVSLAYARARQQPITARQQMDNDPSSEAGPAESGSVSGTPADSTDAPLP